MKTSPLESLQTLVPFVAEDLGVLAVEGSKLQSLIESEDRARQRFDSISDKREDKQSKLEDIFKGIIDKIGETNEMSDLEKIALSSAFSDGHVLRNIQRGGITPEIVFKQAGDRYPTYLSSLRAIQRLTGKPDQQVMYCEIIGGMTMWTLQGPVERPSVSRFFAAKTVGDGLDITCKPGSFGSMDSKLEFNLKDCEPRDIPNFVSGHQDRLGGNKSRVTIWRPEELIGTAQHASMAVKDSFRSLQTNPMFIGEKACVTAVKLLADVRRADKAPGI